MRTKNIWVVMLVAFAFGAVSCGSSGSSEKAKGQSLNTSPPAMANFLALSDIHFNPLYDPSLAQSLMMTEANQWDSVFQTSKVTSYGTYGWSGPFVDTGYPLYKSAMAAAKTANTNPEFIMINGDFLAHNFESAFFNASGTSSMKDLQDFTIKTMNYILDDIATHFPGVPVFPTLGNNDAFCGDYEIRTPGSFLNRTADLFFKNLNGQVDSTAFMKSYREGGYFTATSPRNPNHKIISLNTILLSPKHGHRTDYCGNVPDSAINRADAEKMFAWLDSELSNAQSNNQKVWLMLHIPPGFDSWSTNSHNGSLPASQCQNTVPSSFYELHYNTQYLDVVNKYQSIISAQFGGHTHMDNFMVINGDQTPTSFVHIQPSFSPINGNNPGFIEYDFDLRNGVLKNYEVHGFNNIETVTTPDWKPEYTFSSAYGANELTPQSLKGVYENFLTDQTARERYSEYYVVEDSTSAPITDASWKYYYCAFGNQTVKDYNDCICKMSN